MLENLRSKIMAVSWNHVDLLLFFFTVLGGWDCKEYSYNVGDPDSIPGMGRSPGGGHVFMPGESHGQRNLAGYSPWGHRVRRDWVTNTFTLLLPDLFLEITISLAWGTSWAWECFWRFSGDSNVPPSFRLTALSHCSGGFSRLQLVDTC